MIFEALHLLNKNILVKQFSIIFCYRTVKYRLHIGTCKERYCLLHVDLFSQCIFHLFRSVWQDSFPNGVAYYWTKACCHGIHRFCVLHIYNSLWIWLLFQIQVCFCSEYISCMLQPFYWKLHYQVNQWKEYIYSS